MTTCTCPTCAAIRREIWSARDTAATRTAYERYIRHKLIDHPIPRAGLPWQNWPPLVMPSVLPQEKNS